MMNVRFEVEGMCCGHCAEHIKTLVEKEAGVLGAEVSSEAGSASISYDPHALAEDRLAEIIVEAGFVVRRA